MAVMMETEKCHAGCGRDVLVGRGYCIKCGGINRLRREEYEAKGVERNRKAAARNESENERAAETVRELKRRLHDQGKWGTAGGKANGKTAQKKANRNAAEIEMHKRVDQANRAALVDQKLSVWREVRKVEIAAENRVDMTGQNSASAKGREKVMDLLKAEEVAKRAEFEKLVAAMPHVSPPRIEKPKSEKPKKNKGKKDDDEKGGKGKGKGKNKGGKKGK